MPAMKTVSLHYFRLDAERILAQVMKGERLVLTRRGKPVARLEPIAQDTPDVDDSFYSLTDLDLWHCFRFSENSAGMSSHRKICTAWRVRKAMPRSDSL